MTHFHRQQRTFSGNRERVHSDCIQGCNSIARVWIRSARDAASGHEGAAWRRSEPEDEKVGRPAVLRGPEEGRGTSRYPLFVPRAREPIVTGKLGAVEGPFHFPRGRSCWFRDVGEALSVPAAAANGRRNRRHENSSFRGYEKGEEKGGETEPTRAQPPPIGIRLSLSAVSIITPGLSFRLLCRRPRRRVALSTRHYHSPCLASTSSRGPSTLGSAAEKEGETLTRRADERGRIEGWHASLVEGVV